MCHKSDCVFVSGVGIDVFWLRSICSISTASSVVIKSLGESEGF